jgi:L-histidine Nalpha-methyltransferase / hercynylcysteine S-oxide synthase
MHLETLLYMLIQNDKVLPPSGVAPNFASLAEKARREAVPNEWIKVPSAVITLGSHDPEHDMSFDRYFGWDNEKPERQVEVSSFEAQARALTNEDYARYLEETQQQDLPALWASSADIHKATPPNSNGHPIVNGADFEVDDQPKCPTPAFLEGKYVKTLYGPVPLKYALDWPVIASYDELHGCAKWMGGRIPTAEEVQNIYSYVDVLKVKEAEGVQASRIAAVNG